MRLRFPQMTYGLVYPDSEGRLESFSFVADAEVLEQICPQMYLISYLTSK